jgi:hypothetical protein
VVTKILTQAKPKSVTRAQPLMTLQWKASIITRVRTLKTRVEPSVVEQAARDYLDINCAHCHNPLAVEGQSSQLWLNHDNTDEFHLGICKRPGSAGEGTNGLDDDIVPGAPEESIVHYRTFTEDMGAMIPQIGRSLAHHNSSPIIAAWIENLPPASCSSTEDTGAD